PAPRVDPWLSRPMRHELGLDLPERRIGLSAHDFAQLLGTDDVILSHAAKVGGAPSVASRFLHRLEAVAGEERWKAAKAAGEKYFEPLMERPEARALWWPRFQRIAAWFAGWEIARRENVGAIDAEIRGEIPILLDHERRFVLSAVADRIEHRHDGTFAILDYKTGQPPTGKQVRMGLSPQLTLEAAILREGGFEGIAAGASVSELVYVRL